VQRPVGERTRERRPGEEKRVCLAKGQAKDEVITKHGKLRREAEGAEREERGNISRGGGKPRRRER